MLTIPKLTINSQLSLFRGVEKSRTDFSSDLAKVVEKRTDSTISEQLRYALCNILESSYKSTYKLTIYRAGTICISCSGSSVICTIPDDFLLTGELTVDGNTAKLCLFGDNHYGLISHGEVITTVPVNMFLSVLSELFVRILTMCDIPTTANPLIGESGSMIKYVTEHMGYTGAELTDIQILLDLALNPDKRVDSFGLQELVDGFFIPTTLDGHIDITKIGGSPYV